MTGMEVLMFVVGLLVGAGAMLWGQERAQREHAAELVARQQADVAHQASASSVPPPASPGVLPC